MRLARSRSALKMVSFFLLVSCLAAVIGLVEPRRLGEADSSSSSSSLLSSKLPQRYSLGHHSTENAAVAILNCTCACAVFVPPIILSYGCHVSLDALQLPLVFKYKWRIISETILNVSSKIPKILLDEATTDRLRVSLTVIKLDINMPDHKVIAIMYLLKGLSTTLY